MMNKILMLGSGHSAKQINDIKFDGIIVAINNGWQATDDWNYLVYARDFVGALPEKKSKQVIVNSYHKALGVHGGHLKCGYSITLCASYWVIENLNPSEIYYLGCDMNYTPNENGHTHIYGVGDDIKNNGVSDPDRMAAFYGGQNPEKYLNDIYMRFYDIALNRKIKVFNLSNDENTRLPYPKGEYK